MLILRDRTYKDLNNFIKSRENLPWRNWDKYVMTNTSFYNSTDHQNFQKHYDRELDLFLKIEVLDSNQE